MKIKFFVPGKPVPGGSKKAFIGRSGKVNMVDMGVGNKEWKAKVAAAAADLHRGPLLTGPLEVSMQFVEGRPQDHYGTGRNSGKLRASAPRYPTKRPDVLKLARSTEDALTGVLWRDDCQTIDLTLSKRYAEKPGVFISVWERD
jgi:Holliday junction resolvase RusA-like endonuclease